MDRPLSLRLCTIILVSIALGRILSSFVYAVPPTDTQNDPFGHWKFINQLADDDLSALSPGTPPLTIIVGAAIVKVAGPHDHHVTGFFGLLGALGFIAFFRTLLLGATEHERKWILLAAAGCLLSMKLSLEIWTENLFGPLLWSFAAVVIGPMRPRLGSLLIGALGPLMILSRPTGLPFFIFGIAIWLWRGGSFRNAFSSVAVIAITSILAFTPMFAFSLARWGEVSWSSRNGGVVLYLGNNPEAEGRMHHPSRPWVAEWAAREGYDWSKQNYVEKDRLMRKYVFEWYRSEPDRFASLIGRKIKLLIIGDKPLLYIVGWLLLIAGLLHPMDRWKKSIFVLFVLWPVATCVVFYYHTRYFVPVEPIIRVLQSFGVVTLLQRMRRPRARPAQA